MKQYLNRRLVSNPPSGIRRIGQIAKSIPGCIALTIGEPDFDAPVSIRERIAAAIAGGDTHYPPNAGYGEWLNQIAAHINARFGCDYQAEEVLCTVGSTQALACALFSVLNPGDEVIIFTPCFGLYKPQIEMAGGVCVEMDISKDGFEITPGRLAAHITPRTRALLFASPNNPNGEVLSRASLAALKDAALAHDLFLIADSVYDRIVFDDNFPTLMGDAALRDRLIYVSGLSKSHAMTGVRVGYAAADAPVMAQMRKAHSFLVVSVPGCIQRGCLGAFDEDLSAMTAAYKARRDYVYSRLTAMGLDVRLPGGAFYIFPDVHRFGMTSTAFCERLMHEGKLALIPGECFACEGFVRISYCYEFSLLEEGMNRLEAFIRTL
ncbi:MAG: aminotransferase class I/II-fold pyridoxal phosphate-dependent enzyme [Clostridia bacterium]|nr:aminotransferase class I/II-fold pyridoxal phosphate-dependent enzyme [Clostridia bacterium]